MRSQHSVSRAQGCVKLFPVWASRRMCPPEGRDPACRRRQQPEGWQTAWSPLLLAPRWRLRSRFLPIHSSQPGDVVSPGDLHNLKFCGNWEAFLPSRERIKY